jgi:hypothetical protein
VFSDKGCGVGEASKLSLKKRREVLKKSDLILCEEKEDQHNENKDHQTNPDHEIMVSLAHDLLSNPIPWDRSIARVFCFDGPVLPEFPDKKIRAVVLRPWILPC